MKIDFVRHGQTDSNKKGVMQRWTDTPLNEEGEKEAENTLLSISSDYSLIYSSDLIRCKQTANILNKKMNVTIKYDKRLRERCFGSLEGKTWKDVDSTGTLREKDMVYQQYDYKVYGGESVDDVKKRILSFIEDIKKEINKNEKILIVAHAGVIRLLHHILKGKIPEKIHNASIHEFEFL